MCQRNERGGGIILSAPLTHTQEWRMLHERKYQLLRNGKSAPVAPGRQPGEPEGGLKDCCSSQSGDWRGRHCFSLIFVSFGYRYFKRFLVLCVAKRGESIVKQQEQKKINGSLALKSPCIVVIPANAPEQTRKLRVAAYARVSSNSEDQLNSYAAQNAHYTELITSNPEWEFVDIYADKGITGTSAEKREDFQRLLADCRRGRIDRILVKSSSRFARNAKECLEAVRELKALDVSVCFEEQNIDTAELSGELLVAIFAMMDQRESENISGNICWSIQHRMANGTYIPSSLPFGYKKNQDGEIIIDEIQANYIHKIYTDFLNGRSTEEIAKDLSKQQKTTPGEPHSDEQIPFGVERMSFPRIRRWPSNPLMPPGE